LESFLDSVCAWNAQGGRLVLLFPQSGQQRLKALPVKQLAFTVLVKSSPVAVL
jgi:hypothetical protein